MELGDAGAALRAKAQLAKQHAGEQKQQARSQRARAREQREAEQRAVKAARASTDAGAAFLYCPRCGASWRSDAVRENTRRRPGCLVCGGPLTPLP